MGCRSVCLYWRTCSTKGSTGRHRYCSLVAAVAVEQGYWWEQVEVLLLVEGSP